MTRRPAKTTLSIPPEVKRQARAKVILERYKSLSDVVTRFLRSWVAGEIQLPPDEEEQAKQQ